MRIEVGIDQEVDLPCENAVGVISLDEFKQLLYTALQSEDVVNMALDHPRFNRPPPFLQAV